MERGSRIHDDLEAYLRGWALTLPAEALGWQEAFEALKMPMLSASKAGGLIKIGTSLKTGSSLLHGCAQSPMPITFLSQGH